MSRSRKDRRQHRRKVAGTAQGLAEHRKRNKRRNRAGDPIKPDTQNRRNSVT